MINDNFQSLKKCKKRPVKLIIKVSDDQLFSHLFFLCISEIHLSNTIKLQYLTVEQLY